MSKQADATQATPCQPAMADVTPVIPHATTVVEKQRGGRRANTRSFTPDEDVHIRAALQENDGKQYSEKVSLNGVARVLGTALGRSRSSVRNRIYILLGLVPSRKGKLHRKLLELVLARA